jgi:hypothetical protein
MSGRFASPFLARFGNSTILASPTVEYSVDLLLAGFDADCDDGDPLPLNSIELEQKDHGFTQLQRGDGIVVGLGTR